jgi:TonB-linked SusC/RagA family outer membrane protein
MEFSNSDIEEVLQELFESTNVKYMIKERQIVLYNEEKQARPNSKTNVLQQTINSVSGKVSDNTGESLPGVTVAVKGTANGTITDIDGKYTLDNLPPNATIVFSFVGMKPQEVNVRSAVINITMEEETIGLEEVVAIGYGTVKKRDITGSVASVKGEDLAAIPVASAAEAITGKLAGVQVLSTEGSPDAEMRIRVRGGGSITQDNSPLFIVDGFPVNSISDIAPSDIQSIDVLKDASSTAIYGSRGANGVIIVTTKSGEEGKVTVSYNAYVGYKRIAKKLDVLDPYDYVKWQYEYAVLDNEIDELDSYERYFGSYNDIDLFEGQKGNNWQEQVYGRTGNVFNHDLSVRGGTKKMLYSFNYAHLDEKAIMIGSNFKRDNIALKLNHNPNDKVQLAFSMRFSDTDISGSGANEQNEVSSADSRLKHSVTYTPIPLSGLTTDDTNEEVSSYLINPITSTSDNDRTQQRKNYNMAGSLNWEILKNLQIKTEVGLDNYYYNDNRFYGQTTYYVKNAPAAEYQGLPAVILKDRKQERFRNTNTVNYDFKDLLPQNHNLKLLLGQENIKTQTKELTTTVHGFPALFTSEEAFKLTSQGVAYEIDNNLSPDDKLLSFFGRLSYDYMSKYIFSGTFRADGSSKFSKGNKWGYFPSAAVAWRVSEESFLKDQVNWLQDLKLRFSLGTAGNNNIPSGQMVQSFVSNSTSWISGVSNYWSASKTMANPDLKWETTVTQNIGLDFTMFGGKLNGSVEVYKNKTKDLLIEFPVAGTGYDSQYRNMGKTQNKGLELSLNAVAIDKKDYGLNFTFNIGFNRGKIRSLGIMNDFGASTGWASTEIGDDFWIYKGGQVGEMIGYLSDGRYEVSDFSGYDESSDSWTLKEGVVDVTGIVGDPRPGLMKLKDTDGDDKITLEDRKIIGNANPLHTGGFTINGYAYGFDISAVFNWSYGNDIYNANKIEYTTATPRYQYRNMITMMEEGKRWVDINQADGTLVTDPATLESMNANTSMWSPYMDRYIFSDWAVEDGSFLRLSTLTVGYTLPKSLLEKVKVSNLRFYVTGYNVWKWTNYSGFDPEVSTRRKTALTPGVDYSAYPRSRQIVFGLNLNF